MGVEGIGYEAIRLRFNQTERNFGENRKAADRSIFRLEIELLEIDVIRGAGEIWPRCLPLISASALRVEVFRAIGSIFVEARVEANTNLGPDDRIIDIPDHATSKRWPFDFVTGVAGL